VITLRIFSRSFEANMPLMNGHHALDQSKLSEMSSQDASDLGD
jgi:hypothetical protein